MYNYELTTICWSWAPSQFFVAVFSFTKKTTEAFKLLISLKQFVVRDERVVLHVMNKF